MKAQAQVEQKEALHHDRWAKSVAAEDVLVEKAMNSCSAPENRQILQWMGDLRGKKILELGAGLGEASIYFAQRGALVTATDISPGMLEKIQEVAKLRGVQLETKVASANDLSMFPDNHFDFVYAANLLHHVNISECVAQVFTKLKVGGEALTWDPVLYNPVIQVYRRMATQVRTEDEHPLTRGDLSLIQRTFGQAEFRFFWLTGLVIFLKYFLIDRIHPNQSRYWKKILEDADSIATWMEPLHRIDTWLMRWIPGLKYWAWNVAIRAKKS